MVRLILTKFFMMNGSLDGLDMIPDPVGVTVIEFPEIFLRFKERSYVGGGEKEKINKKDKC